MQSDKYKYSTYSELDREYVRETLRKDLMKILDNMPESTNDHKKVSIEYRIDRIMECVDILRDPSSSLEEKARARKKKYKLLHPDRANTEQNERRRKQYQENKYGYADKVRKRTNEFREINQEYRLDSIRRSSIDSNEKRNYILAKLGGHCVLCGNTNYSSLEVHHVNPEEKKYNVHEVDALKYRNLLDEELKKCVLLCIPCHHNITILQRFLRSCQNTNMSIENLFKIFKYYKEGKTVLEISFLLGINFTMIKQILFDGRFKILTQIGTPYIQPPFFNFNTFYRLQEYVRIREFNQRNVAKGGGIIPMAPLNVDNFITPYNLDQMEAREGTIGTFYGIPGAKAVTPFDFDDYK